MLTSTDLDIMRLLVHQVLGPTDLPVVIFIHHDERCQRNGVDCATEEAILRSSDLGHQPQGAGVAPHLHHIINLIISEIITSTSARFSLSGPWHNHGFPVDLPCVA